MGGVSIERVGASAGFHVSKPLRRACALRISQKGIV